MKAQTEAAKDPLLSSFTMAMVLDNGNVQTFTRVINAIFVVAVVSFSKGSLLLHIDASNKCCSLF